MSYKGIFPVSVGMSFPDLSRHSFSSQTDSVDSDAEVILNLLSLAWKWHCFSWHSCPLWSGGVFRLVLPRYALSFPDSVSLGKDSRKVPRKSIQYYLAMYPRINGQVSSITLPSILASFFSLPCRSPARSVVELDVQACLWHKGVKSYRTARTFPPAFPTE